MALGGQCPTPILCAANTVSNPHHRPSLPGRAGARGVAPTCRRVGRYRHRAARASPDRRAVPRDAPAPTGGGSSSPGDGRITGRYACRQPWLRTSKAVRGTGATTRCRRSISPSSHLPAARQGARRVVRDQRHGLYPGHALDYQHWAEESAAGWSYAEVLPYFRRSERHSRGEDP